MEDEDSSDSESCSSDEDEWMHGGAFMCSLQFLVHFIHNKFILPKKYILMCKMYSVCFTLPTSTITKMLKVAPKLKRTVSSKSYKWGWGYEKNYYKIKY